MLGMITLVATVALAAQQEIVIRGEAECVDCAIETRRVTSLGRAEGIGAFSGGPRSLARDSRGRFYAADMTDAGRVLVFDQVGAPMAEIGGPGQGPGEFGAVQGILVLPGDSLAVFDRGNARLSVFRPTGELGRTQSWPFAGDRVLLLDDSLVVTAGIDGWRPTGRDPLQAHKSDGTRLWVGGFDHQRDVDRPLVQTRPFERDRVLGLGRSGVWVARPNELRLELWSPGGSIAKTVTRDVPWFRPYKGRRRPSPIDPPQPFLSAAWEGPGGLLWVVAHVRAEDWTRGVGEPEEARGQIFYELSSDELYDSRIEVYDLARGVVVAVERVGDNIVGFLPTGLAVAVRHDAFDIPYVDILEMALVRPSRPDGRAAR